MGTPRSDGQANAIGLRSNAGQHLAGQKAAVPLVAWLAIVCGQNELLSGVCPNPKL